MSPAEDYTIYHAKALQALRLTTSAAIALSDHPNATYEELLPVIQSSLAAPAPHSTRSSRKRRLSSSDVPTESIEPCSAAESSAVVREEATTEQQSNEAMSVPLESAARGFEADGEGDSLALAHDEGVSTVSNEP